MQASIVINFYFLNKIGVGPPHYIGLDTSYDKIEDFTQNVMRGVASPPGGVRPQFFF